MQHRSDEEILASYKGLHDFLRECINLDCDMALYRIEPYQNDGAERGTVIASYACSPDSSFVKVGEAIPPFTEGVLLTMRKRQTPVMTHVDVEGTTIRGPVKLCFFAIQNGDGKVIGLIELCIHIDSYFNVIRSANEFLGIAQEGVSTTDVMPFMDESTTIPLKDYVDKLIQEQISIRGVPATEMTTEDKKQIVKNLSDLGVFYVKDSVRNTASLLDISVPSLYRFIKETE